MNTIEHAVFVHHCAGHGYFVRYFGSAAIRCPACDEYCELTSSLDPAAFIQAILNYTEAGRKRLIDSVSAKNLKGKS